MALLISAAGSVLGTLVLTPLKWLWNKIKGRPTVQASDRSIAAGRDVSGQVATGDQPTVAGQAGVIMGAGSVTHIHQEGLDEKSRERLAHIESKLDEVKEKLAAPPPGATVPDTHALVSQATERTEKLLAEALELQRQHKQRDAIERLLTAYDMDMPAQAKAQLHILAGNGFLRVSELEQAEGHYLQALEAAELAEHKQGEAAAIGNLGLVYADRGDLEKAEEHHKTALAIDDEIGNRLGQAQDLGNLGNVYLQRGALDAAEEHFKKALAIDEEIGNRVGQANALGSLGLVHADRGDLDKAEEYHKNGLHIHEEMGDKLAQAQDLGNLGLVYADRGDLEKAEEHLKRALDIQQEIGDKLGQARQLGNLGLVYQVRGDTEKAEEYHRRSAAIHKDIGNRLDQAAALGNLGLLAMKRGHTRTARDLFQQAAKLYEEIGAGGEGPEMVREALQRLEAPPSDD